MEIGIERFQRQLLGLEPVEFLGVAKILGVKVLTILRNKFRKKVWK